MYTFEERVAILKLLREHISNNVIKVNLNKLITFRLAIDFIVKKWEYLKAPFCQQSCAGKPFIVAQFSFYYGQLEAKELVYLKDDESLLIRFVDDFLFVSTNRDAAEQFLTRMHQGDSLMARYTHSSQGFPDYNSSVNQEKTLANFSIEIDDKPIKTIGDGLSSFPWCGLLIGMEDLNVKSDYSKVSSSSKFL